MHCICICVFACKTPGNTISNIPVPSAFQKYSTCMVHSDSIFFWREFTLRGVWGGAYAFSQPVKATYTFYPVPERLNVRFWQNLAIGKSDILCLHLQELFLVDGDLHVSN